MICINSLICAMFVMTIVAAPMSEEALMAMRKELLQAIKQDSFEQVKDILEKVKDDPGDRAQLLGKEHIMDAIPLHVAAEKGNKEIIELLVKNGSDLTANDSAGRWPFDVAVETKKDVAILELLFRESVHLNDRLIPAVSADNVPAIEFLVKKGADIKEIDKDGNTLLHIAAPRGALDAVKYLLKNGLDVNKENNRRDTALARAINRYETMKILNHVAQSETMKAIIEQLYLFGADVSKKVASLGNKTPLEYVKKDNLRELATVLTKPQPILLQEDAKKVKDLLSQLHYDLLAMSAVM